MLDVSADTNQVAFSVDDEDSEAVVESPGRQYGGQNGVLDFRMKCTPLWSTIQSREAGAYFCARNSTHLISACTEYELDSDDFDDASLADIQREQRHSCGAPRRERTMPLLVGLMDASAARRMPDTVIPMYETDSMENGELRNVDLDDLAKKQWSGGGLLNSVANMANSILRAGKLLELLVGQDAISATDLANTAVALPYAVNQAGFFLGIVLLVVICAVTDWTIRLVVINAKLSGRISYIKVMNSRFGPSGRAPVSFFQFSFAFGGMCALVLLSASAGFLVY
ncbi:uncharacterized protein F5891DRAFT_1177175 [Suillus fuscotomentosus]|uniref:Amino acid transporter transmembrane domain-containing protein n=1 Tax=Suillus fuscotomentosus TaxID=1912939 RepID=A0AAD4DQA0_9AGAM|nr:uncharacterized protein F5891DRAFT_1177175 [Suillus fuscotomentosus]KAG1889083.1 hypothetical protein F5891DRAFT_1177175 [Suillus fuscotomentosus]